MKSLLSLVLAGVAEAIADAAQTLADDAVDFRFPENTDQVVGAMTQDTDPLNKAFAGEETAVDKPDEPRSYDPYLFLELLRLTYAELDFATRAKQAREAYDMIRGIK